MIQKYIVTLGKVLKKPSTYLKKGERDWLFIFSMSNLKRGGNWKSTQKWDKLGNM